MDGEAELLLRINGRHAAWPARLAGRSPRDAEVRRAPYRAANTSISLLLRRGGELLLHVLIDVGLGVVNSLLELERTGGVDRVDALCLTHSHFDHIAGLDWLLASLARSPVAGQPWPLPLFCTSACFDEVFEPPRMLYFWRASVAHTPLLPGAPVTIAGRGGAVITVSAVPVEHGPTAPGAAILAVETRWTGRPLRFGFAWDLLRLAPGAEPAPFFDCDLLFVDSTTVHPMHDPENPAGHRNWHISVEEMLALTAPWRPRRTYLIHYAGSRDDEPSPHDCLAPEVTRPLTNAELRRLAARLGKTHARDLRVAAHGRVIRYSG